MSSGWPLPTMGPGGAGESRPTLSTGSQSRLATEDQFAPPPGGPPPPPGGGAWTWQPPGMERKRPLRKRRPVLFWGGFFLLLCSIFILGRMSEDLLKNEPRIAVIQVEGMILDADAIVAFTDKIRGDSAIKGAVVRINSPGGAVGPSQELYAAVKRLAGAKPVVASMSSVAASGGYYAALGAHRIIAGPSTITGSIGVRVQIPNFEGLMRTIGISETTLATGELKDAGSGWREMKPQEAAYFQALITDMYEEFIATIGRERQLSPDEVRAVADGRAMTGRQALEAGLVDELGDFYAAVSRTKELAGIAADEKVFLVKGPKKREGWLVWLIGQALHTIREQAGAARQPIFIY